MAVFLEEAAAAQNKSLAGDPDPLGIRGELAGIDRSKNLRPKWSQKQLSIADEAIDPTIVFSPYNIAELMAMSEEGYDSHDDADHHRENPTCQTCLARWYAYQLRKSINFAM